MIARWLFGASIRLLEWLVVPATGRRRAVRPQLDPEFERLASVHERIERELRHDRFGPRLGMTLAPLVDLVAPPDERGMWLSGYAVPGAPRGLVVATGTPLVLVGGEQDTGDGRSANCEYLEDRRTGRTYVVTTDGRSPLGAQLAADLLVCADEPIFAEPYRLELLRRDLLRLVPDAGLGPELRRTERDLAQLASPG